MPENGYNRPQFFYLSLEVDQRRSIAIIHLESLKDVESVLAFREKIVHYLLF